MRNRKAGRIVCTNVCCEVRNLFCQPEHSESVARPDRGRCSWVDQGLTCSRCYDDYRYTEPFPDAGLREGLTSQNFPTVTSSSNGRSPASGVGCMFSSPALSAFTYACALGFGKDKYCSAFANQHSRGLDLRLDDLRSATGQENLTVDRAMGASDDGNCTI